jgi:glycosyltransferase involved in cell wall biosynthesis
MIDDGSRDNTWQVLNEYANKDSRLEVYHQSNQGVAATRNNLLHNVKGDFILFVDADDWIEPDMVEFLVNRSICLDADVVICDMVINEASVSKSYEEQAFDRDAIIKTFLFHKELKGSLCNKLIKTSLLHGLEFNPAISYGEDALFCWHFFQRVDKVIMTTRQLYHYRMNNDSISHQTFGDKKLTGHQTWKIITAEVAQFCPQYINISQARWGMEDMYLLRQAGQSGYKKDAAIAKLQHIVKDFMPVMRSLGLLAGKEVFNAFMMSKWYGYGLLYYKLHKIKSRIKWY